MSEKIRSYAAYLRTQHQPVAERPLVVTGQSLNLIADRLDEAADVFERKQFLPPIQVEEVRRVFFQDCNTAFNILATRRRRELETELSIGSL